MTADFKSVHFHPLTWTGDGFAATPVGAYRIAVSNGDISLHWLGIGALFWQRVSRETTITHAKSSAAIHASMNAEDRARVVSTDKD